jgi:hypothetical protein
MKGKDTNAKPQTIRMSFLVRVYSQVLNLNKEIYEK